MGEVPMKQSYQIQVIIRRLGMEFEHTLGYGGASMGGDPPLEYRQQDACRLPLFLVEDRVFLV